MKRWRLLGCLVLAGLLALALGPTLATQAQGEVIFEVAVSSAYLRDAPSPAAARTYSVFQGQRYTVNARTLDGAWMRLDFAGANRGTWVPARYGKLTGDLSSLPAVAAGADTVTLPQATASPEASAGTGGTGAVEMRLTITLNSTFVRELPNWSSRRVLSLFRNQVVPVVARDYAANWLHLKGSGWVPAGVGTLDGKVLALPIEGGAPAVPTVPPNLLVPSEPLPAWIPPLTPRLRQLYVEAGQAGHNLTVFTVVGDCNSENYIFTDLIYAGWYGYKGNEYLMPTWQRFRKALARHSLAVNGGFNSASVLDPTWADPTQCKPGESPFACELRVSRASIAFILLGTGDQFQWQGFEANYRRMIEQAMSDHVLPVLVTKADALESEEGGAEPGYINDIIRRLAVEYQVPLLDFDQAVKELPNHGLTDEPGPDFHLNAEAIGVHVLATMQTLYVIWQAH